MNLWLTTRTWADKFTAGRAGGLTSGLTRIGAGELKAGLTRIGAGELKAGFMRIGAIELMAGLTGRLSGWLDQNRGR
jgi:hypothetical protein